MDLFMNEYELWKCWCGVYVYWLIIIGVLCFLFSGLVVGISKLFCFFYV